jgi:predicted anti-sigma-YlaC factor YlaD
MNCSFDKDLLQEYAIGEVAEADRGTVEVHLTGCASCRLEVADLRRLARDLSSIPEPEFPADLEEVLVRAAIQAGRTQQPVRESSLHPSGIRRSWALVLAGSVGLALAIFVVVSLWPTRLGLPVAGGGGAQGLGLVDSLLHWVETVQSFWTTATEFLDRFAPLRKAVRAGLGGGLTVSLIAAVGLGAATTGLVLWRIAGPRKRRVNHAKPNC